MCICPTSDSSLGSPHWWYDYSSNVHIATTIPQQYLIQQTQVHCNCNLNNHAIHFSWSSNWVCDSWQGPSYRRFVSWRGSIPLCCVGFNQVIDYWLSIREDNIISTQIRTWRDFVGTGDVSKYRSHIYLRDFIESAELFAVWLVVLPHTHAVSSRLVGLVVMLHTKLSKIINHFPNTIPAVITINPS